MVLHPAIKTVLVHFMLQIGKKVQKSVGWLRHYELKIYSTHKTFSMIVIIIVYVRKMFIFSMPY